jgi:hypothetical protein
MNAGLLRELQVPSNWVGRVRRGCCGWRRVWIASRSVVEADGILSAAVDAYRAALDAYRAALGERLVAAEALGSLAHGRSALL